MSSLLIPSELMSQVSCLLRSVTNVHRKLLGLPLSMSIVFLVQRMVSLELPTVETGVLGSLMKQSPGKGNPSLLMRSKKYLLYCCSLNVATPA